MSRALLFVYGSLKRGYQHHAELTPPGQPAAQFCGAAVTQDRWRLFQVEHYPALVPAPPAGARGVGAAGLDHIAGELYWVAPPLLAALDRFEECPELYQRVAVEVRPLPPGSPSVTAQSYIMSAAQIARLVQQGRAAQVQRASW